MAKTMLLGREDAVPVTVNTNRLEGSGAKYGRTMRVLEADVDFWLVTDPATVAAEGTIPAAGRQFYAADKVPFEIFVGDYGEIGLLAGGAGTVRLVLE